MALAWNRKARRGKLRALDRAAVNNPEAPTHIFFLLHASGVCKFGGMPLLLLLQVQCRWCTLPFYVCRCCWRGQAYCCDECRFSARRKMHREAQRRYRRTEKGKKAHRNAENRRRQKNQANRKNMDDAASTPGRIWDTEKLEGEKSPLLLIAPEARCHFCGATGQIVRQFPRRGYG